MTLSDKRNIQYADAKGLVEAQYPERDVKEAIKKLKKRGLEKTLYPKYLMLTIDDLREIFGDKLT